MTRRIFLTRNTPTPRTNGLWVSLWRSFKTLSTESSSTNVLNMKKPVESRQWAGSVAWDQKCGRSTQIRSQADSPFRQEIQWLHFTATEYWSYHARQNSATWNSQSTKPGQADNRNNSSWPRSPMSCKPRECSYHVPKRSPRDSKQQQGNG